MPTIESTPEFVAQAYDKIRERLAVVRRRLARPLTYAEKVLFQAATQAEETAAAANKYRDRVMAEAQAEAKALLEEANTLKDEASKLASSPRTRRHRWPSSRKRPRQGSASSTGVMPRSRPSSTS